jgi:hypothetical protein
VADEEDQTAMRWWRYLGLLGIFKYRNNWFATTQYGLEWLGVTREEFS